MVSFYRVVFSFLLLSLLLFPPVLYCDFLWCLDSPIPLECMGEGFVIYLLESGRFISSLLEDLIYRMRVE